jgi:hypothetical protein
MELEYYHEMDSTIRLPVTAAIFSAAAILLSGCIAYDAARTTVDAGTAVVGVGVGVISTAGDIATAPFGHGDAKDDHSK